MYNVEAVIGDFIVIMQNKDIYRKPTESKIKHRDNN